MYSTNNYIAWYNKLSTNSQSVNSKLLQLQSSEEAWKVGKELMTIPEYHLHGCQLISKKLNNPITFPDSVLQELQQFLLSFSNPPQTLFYCIAKIHLHLGRRNIKIYAELFKLPYTIIKILTYLPQAMVSIRVIHDDSLREIAEQVWNNHKGTVLQSFKVIPKQVLKCIDNYVSNNIKLAQPNLVRLLMTQPIQQISTTLQQVLLQQKYEQLNEQLFNYFNNTKLQHNIQSFFGPYVAFCRSLSLLTLPYEFIHSSLQKIICIMGIMNEQEDKEYVTEAFQLWQDLSTQLREHNCQPNIKNLVYDAFVQVWRIVIKRSILAQLPSPQSQQAYKIDIDDQQELDNQILQLNHNGAVNMRFRNIAQDFIILCISTLLKSKQHVIKMFTPLMELTRSQNNEQIQLAIFALQTVLGIMPTQEVESIQYINKIIQQIIKTKLYCAHDYIAKELLKLIGQSGSLLFTQNRMLILSLDLIIYSLTKQTLFSLGATTLNEILQCVQQVKIQSSYEKDLENFINQIYQSIYILTQNQKLFISITKSLIIFIYKLKKDQSALQQFLTIYHQKINNLPTLRKRQFLQALLTVHIATTKQISSQFTNILAQFMIGFKDQLVGYVKMCDDKKQVNKVLITLKFMVVSVGGYYTKEWIHCIRQLYTLLSQKQYILSSVVLLTIKLITSQDYDSNYHPLIPPFLSQVQPFLTNCLLKLTTDNYDLIKNILMFNLTILNSFLGSYKFNPQSLLNFIINEIIRNSSFWEYQTIRTALAILVNIIKNNYRVQEILHQVLLVYPKYKNSFSRSLQTILIQSYKASGMNIFHNSFKVIKPNMLPPNPAWQQLNLALLNGQNKTIKNILLQLE